ncbi:P-loop containing nucleoside triphosphate hydrolase protein [Pyrenochaeta sp. DS3sAY3a]|nr:P-loop containing nucleoside triphosphate hydrolase protein [Pyrenochaeta sp. DS3sAY3a]
MSQPPSSLSRLSRRRAGALLWGGGAERILGKRKSAQQATHGAKRPATTDAATQKTSRDEDSRHEPSDSSSEDDAEDQAHSQVDVGVDLNADPPRELKSSHDHGSPVGQEHVFQVRTVPRRRSFSGCEISSCIAKEVASTRDTGNATWTTSDSSQMHQRGFPIVYRIECSEGNHQSRYHKTFLYEDDPLTAHFSDGRQSSHLSGNKPIYQLQDHVRRFQQHSFVIMKTRQCSSQAGLSSFYTTRDEIIQILNNDLRKAILKVATCSLEQFSRNGVLEFYAPYQPIYLHRELMHTYAQSTTSELKREIETVVQYVVAKYGHEYKEAEELMSQNMITRRHLDKVFWPNQLVYATFGSIEADALEETEVYVVEDWPASKGDKLLMKVWNWGFFGDWCFRQSMPRIFGAHVEEETEPFPISSLLLFPFSVISEQVRESLRQRGKCFWGLRQPSFAYSTGTKRIKPGRYMIDHAIHSRLHGLSTPYQEKRTNKQTDPFSSQLYRESIPTEDEYLIMPRTVPGYDLNTKEWGFLPVSSIGPIRWNKQPFEDLVLPDETKLLVRAMVTVRASSIKSRHEEHLRAEFDVIPGKGNGLIMLFHGSPGTGKTLTAESVAEIAEMPLYPITCGDLGTDPDKVEEYLRLVFELGQRWNCVLLLDEADVFLEQRTLTDLQRNSLVSVFLRMLEYYEGILILTSNRVGIFDEAFRSRIHIALHYEDLKPRARKQIWLNFLTRLEDSDEGGGVEEIKARVDELARHQLNGREIRNAISTARQLASYEGKTMGWEHVELAITTADKFGTYLRNVHGHTDLEWAKEKGER